MWSPPIVMIRAPSAMSAYACSSICSDRFRRCRKAYRRYRRRRRPAGWRTASPPSAGGRAAAPVSTAEHGPARIARRADSSPRCRTECRRRRRRRSARRRCVAAARMWRSPRSAARPFRRPAVPARIVASCPASCRPSVDLDGLADERAHVVAGQQRDRSGDVVRLSDVADRYSARVLLVHLGECDARVVGVDLQLWRVDDSRRDAVDGDVLGREFAAERSSSTRSGRPWTPRRRPHSASR